jgi:ceramide glucosyltransferase
MLSLLVIFCSVYIGLMATKVVLAWVYSARDRCHSPPVLEHGAVVVAQAILSGDPDLKSVLESNLRSLGGQHFVWLCDEGDEEALRIVQDLKERYIRERITILCCPPCPEGENPKVFKLRRAVEISDARYFLVLDDDTHLPALTASVLVEQAAVHAVATGLPEYENGPNLASRLLAQFVNNNSALTYLALLPVMRPISINGMCYVIEQSGTGMFERISGHLTDDLALANAIQEAGGSIYQSSYPQRVATRVDGLAHYTRLMHRWFLFVILLLKKQPVGRRWVIGVVHGSHPLILWAILGILVADYTSMAGSICVTLIIARMFLIGAMQMRLFGRWVHLPFVSILSELLQPFHLAQALINRDIVWRTRRYRVRDSHDFEEVSG